MLKEKDLKTQKLDENSSSYNTTTIKVILKRSDVTTPGAHDISKQDLRSILNERIIRNESEPLLTLFTTWNDNGEKYVVHNLTVRNWLLLRPFVIPVIFTNNQGIAIECKRNGWSVFPVRVAAADGMPVLKYMYEDVMTAYNTTFYAYSNSDILYTDTLIDTLVSYAYSNDGFLYTDSLTDTPVPLIKSNVLQKPVMIIGRRTNVENVTGQEGSTWKEITLVARERGKLFQVNAEDYFITTKIYPWKDIAEVVIGIRAYDNWLVYNARRKKHTLVDATSTILAVHQTTSAGNYEGHGHRNGEYNVNLLRKMYKRIKYDAGLIGCADYYSQYQHGRIVVTNRVVPKQCFV